MQSLWGFTLVDGVSLVICLFYAVEGFQLGFLRSLLDLLSFVLSFVIAIRSYSLVAAGIVYISSLPLGFANALGFFLTALVCEILLNTLFRVYNHRIYLFLSRFPRLQKAERSLGIIPNLISALVILAFLANVIVALPSSPYLKQQVTQSKSGALLLSFSSGFEKRLSTIFGAAIQDTLTFMTVEPKSTETVKLHFTVKNGAVDQQAEREMLDLVNAERVKRGIAPVTMDQTLQQLARAYSQDMFSNGYFSHYNTAGLSPFDRMEKMGIQYSSAGENLALAPSTSLAMQGLMNSPGHRDNILKKDFRKIGIGCIDGGIYGKMFTQEFTD